MCILLNVKKHEKTFALNVDIFIHDYCYKRGFTIYPGKINNTETFRLCALGAIDQSDIETFFEVFEAGLREMEVSLPVHYGLEEQTDERE